MKIEFHIEKLILHGFSRKDAFYIQREVQRSLSRLIENGGLSNLSTAKREIHNLQSPSIHIKPSSRPEATGQKIANSIYSGISQTITSKDT